MSDNKKPVANVWGNSNWRGPVWMPVNMLILRALLNLPLIKQDYIPSSKSWSTSSGITAFSAAVKGAVVSA